ncbi:MAG: transcriptional regulator PpsR [Pseudomonadota bacterium]
MSADGTDSPSYRPSEKIEAGSFDSVLAQASDLMLSVTRDGEIRSLRANRRFNPTGETLTAWIGRNIKSVLTLDSARKFEQRIENADRVDDAPLQLNHLDEARIEFPIEYHCVAQSEGETILMIGRSLMMIAEIQQSLTSMQMELERERDTQRRFEASYRMLLRQGEDPVMIVDADTGEVIDASEAVSSVLRESRESLVGRPLAQIAKQVDDADDRGALSALQAAAQSGAAVAMRRARSAEAHSIMVTASQHRVVGDRVLFLRMTPERALGDGVSRLTKAMSTFFTRSADAIAITTPTGDLVDANEAFINLTGISDPSRLTERNLDDFLARGGIDSRIIYRSLADTRRIYAYQTTVRDELGAEAKVDLAGYALEIEGEQAILFLLRDLRARPAKVQGPEVLTDEAAQNIVDLIGGVDLKEIVSDTTEVVEKMCIEVVLEMTSNNRVAAANMLGLSRQSLYVKMRKYGIT